jgi:hypothetical protein
MTYRGKKKTKNQVVSASVTRRHPSTTDNINITNKRQHMINPSQVLHAAAQAMEDRAKTYDSPDGERSMGKAVEMYSILTGQHMTTQQGWLMMAIIKMVRSQQGNYHLDNYIDGAAYLSLAAEAAEQEHMAGLA